MHRVLLEPYQVLVLVLEEGAFDYLRHNKKTTTAPQVLPSEF